MKAKKRKLALNKTTVANLNMVDLAKVFGGDFSDLTDCKYCHSETIGDTEDGCVPWTDWSQCYTKTTCMSCGC